jgi:methionine synthase II (cobalamin-independent)
MSETLHRNPPFRAEHLGSLLRPEHLLQTRNDVEENKVPKDQLTNTEDETIKEIVKLQQDLGFRALTDGEYRRHSLSF